MVLPESVDDHIKVVILQPGAGYVSVGQQVAVFIHQKGRAFGPIAVGNCVIFLQPILHQNKGHRVGVFVGIVFKDG